MTTEILRKKVKEYKIIVRFRYKQDGKEDGYWKKGCVRCVMRKKRKQTIYNKTKTKKYLC